MKIVTTADITERQIADLMVTAIESGIGYWAKRVALVDGDYQHAIEMAHKTVWYDAAPLYGDAEMLKIEVIEIEASKGNKKRHIIGLEEINSGFQIMSQLKTGEGGHHWRDLLDGTGDATTADVWLQCCVFGEIVYG